MSLSKWIWLVTPKFYERAMEVVSMSEECKDVEVVACSDIYMNMVSGWTEEECDNSVYIVEREGFNKIKDSLFTKLLK